jgi:hypothetical protein
MAIAKADAGARICGPQICRSVSGAGPSCFGEPARRILARVGGTTVHIVPWAFDTAEMLHNIFF